VLYSNLVAVASNNGTVYALDAGNGSFKWKFSTGAGSGTSPWIAVAQNIVYSGSGSSAVYAINGGNGSQAWKYATGGPVNSPAVGQ
jgi:outer membrane protein assembly factor BamB